MEFRPGWVSSFGHSEGSWMPPLPLSTLSLRGWILFFSSASCWLRHVLTSGLSWDVLTWCLCAVLWLTGPAVMSHRLSVFLDMWQQHWARLGWDCLSSPLPTRSASAFLLVMLEFCFSTPDLLHAEAWPKRSVLVSVSKLVHPSSGLVILSFSPTGPALGLFPTT